MDNGALRSERRLLACTVFLTVISAAIPAIPGPGGSTEGKIVFHSSAGGNNTQIFVMDADGTGREQLTDNSFSNVAPEISPDGSQIVFVSDRDGSNHVHLMDIDGNNQRRLTDVPDEEGEPTWAPSGNRIYYRRISPDGTVMLCAVNTDGSNLTQVTDGSIRYFRPHVSRDEAQILAVSVTRGFELYLMDSDGSNQRKFPNAPAGVAFASWHPDGEKIVFATSNPPPNVGADIHVINADGTGHIQLTHGEGVSEYPCWSADGEEIAFQTSRDGNFEIYVMSADGSQPRRLTNNPGLDGRPSWGR
jgi:TolB protein